MKEKEIGGGETKGNEAKGDGFVTVKGKKAKKGATEEVREVWRKKVPERTS